MLKLLSNTIKTVAKKKKFKKFFKSAKNCHD